MKHVGKMKNNGARVAIVFRTLPGDPHSALVIGTGSLGESYHDALMSLIQDDSAQAANELADVLSVRKFPDGNNMLSWLHNRNQLKKVPTNLVIVTPTPQSSVPLDELNKLIAEQKGITLEELSVTEEGKSTKPVKAAKKDDPTKTTSSSVSGEEEVVAEQEVTVESVVEELTPTQLRSKADKLFKEAQLLRKQADALDPPKKKTKKEAVEA
jgi:hypothetical protein